MMPLFSYSRFHLIGIQGVGMTPLALILTDMGKKVTGSDMAESFMTEEYLTKRNITVHKGFNAHNLGDAEVVIYTGAVGGGNAELDEARKKNLPIVPLADALGELSKLKQTVSVCGCHGKTTTTSLVAHIGQELTKEFSWYVGAPGFMHYAPGQWSTTGDYFAVESDEYVIDPFSNKSAKFLLLSPSYIVCTNIDYDHPDVYPNIQAVEAAYTLFFDKLREGGSLIVNGDDPRALFVAKASGKPLHTYGFGEANDFAISNVEYNTRGARFNVVYRGKLLGEFATQLSGAHNVSNATAAIALFSLLGRDTNHIARALTSFTGAKRRLELHGKVGESYVYDDYAHHPAEIAATIGGLRRRYPKHKLVVIFHPHTYTRTASLKSEFVEALQLADTAGILPIFASARENPAEIPIHSEDLVEEAHSRGFTHVRFVADEAAIAELVTGVCRAREDAVYVTMGAGDVYKHVPLITQVLKDNYSI